MQQKIKLILVICVNLLILTDLPMSIQDTINKNNNNRFEDTDQNYLVSNIINQITTSVIYVLITLIFYKLY